MPEISDTKPITRQVQDILRGGDATITAAAAAAAALVADCARKPECLAEVLCLFNAPGLTPAQKKQMLQDAGLESTAMDLWADICARAGRYGFSFPQWRFLCQSFDGSSLMERYGFTRLSRTTDVRDATLPPRDPARDEFGVGFIKQNGNRFIEYRRAYVLAARLGAGAQAGSAILIRNSSYYFGRDRLAAPVYVAQGTITADALQAVTPASFGVGGLFRPLHTGVPPALLQNLLDDLDAEDMALSSWLEQGGQGDLAAFLRHTACIVPVHPAHIDARMPPWFPLPAQVPGAKLVLLSGAQGDLAA